MTMTSRNRVRCILVGKMPDRVANGLGACETTGMHLLTYQKLQELTGKKDSPPKLDTFMLNAVFEQDVIEAIDGDMILLASPRMCRSMFRGDEHDPLWKEQTLWGKTFKVSVKEEFTSHTDGSMTWESAGGLLCPPSSLYFDSVQSSDFSFDYIIPAANQYNPPHNLSDSLLKTLERAAKQLFEDTELSICCGETIEDLQVSPAGYVGTMLLLRENPDIMHEFLDKAVSASIAQLQQLEQAIGKYTDVLSIAHDFGDNRGVMIGPDLWRQIYKPHYKRWFREWKKISGMKINLHTCGSVADILPDLIECGLDMINPVQISAAKMDPQSLKEAFGQKLVFYGGAYDAQSISRDADYETVYAMTKKNCEILKKSGRYIFAGVHNLPGDMPKSHIKAMLDAYRDTRKY